MILWNKKYTETLAETLERFRARYPQYQKVTYAGRLDPMAEGLLILLTNESVHEKESYNGLDKVYEVDFMLGVATDSYDILGLITDTSHKKVSQENIHDVLNTCIGKITQSYPPYSSKTVSGKPLFLWAREGRLDEIDIPASEREIYDIQLLDSRVYQLSEIKDYIINAIDSVRGDFRQPDSIKTWQNFFRQISSDSMFPVYTIRAHASSGTYMRSLIHDLGKHLGVYACVLKIRRTRIGNIDINSLK